MIVFIKLLSLQLIQRYFYRKLQDKTDDYTLELLW